MLFAAFLEVIIYICLHEGGHALVAVMCGAEIIAFNIIGANVSWMGGNFNQFTFSLAQIAGMAFPVIISVCYMLFVFNKNKQGIFYSAFSFFFAVIPVGSILAWVFVPIAYIAGDTENPDDVIQFLNTSGINPVILMISSLAAFILIIILAWKKGVIRAWMNLIRESKD